MSETMTAPAGADDARELVAAALDALERRTPFMGENEVSTLPEVFAITAAPDGVRRHCILLATYHDRIEGYPDEHRIHWHAALRMLAVIARTPAGLTADDIELLLPVPDKRWDAGLSQTPDELRLGALLPQIESAWQSLGGIGRDGLRARLREAAATTGLRDDAARLLALTDDAADHLPLDYISTRDAVGQALRDALAASPEEPAALAAVIRLLAAYPADGKPKAQWRKDAATAAAGLTAPVTLAAALLNAATAAPDSCYERYDLHMGKDVSYVTWAASRNEVTLWGLTGLAAVIARRYEGGADLLPLLRALAQKAITYIPDHSSPRSLGLATRCVAAITDAAVPESLPELLRVERGFRHGTIVQKAHRAVGALAARQGLGRDELLELAVERHGLAPDGTRRAELAGGWAAVLAVGPRTARVSYLGPGGKSRASLPAAVKAESADALAALQKDLKAVRSTVADERSRLDGLLAGGRSRPVRAWRERYLGHPLTGQLARTLIWQFTTPDGVTITGLPADSAPPAATVLIMRDGTSAAVPEDAEVRLWHPAAAERTEVAAWRSLLLQRKIMQPVRQAFREVYVPTPAEEATRDYSNRFAGHVFQQVQARALMKGRGWKPVPLASGWDDGIDQGVARKEYPDAGLRAEFFFDYSGSDEQVANLDAYVTSDQVRFFDTDTDTDTGDAVTVECVPPLVFTETMRDVDLFIGVTSIGNDPQWLDRGGGRRFGDAYWHRFGFGDLPARAEVRRDVLSHLVPMLTIADRCAVQDRFLEVRGDLRTYRIHLGSGNILMSPNDQYLCIVAARSAQASKVFLPFDDDPVLTDILSKAFLLAADTAVTDPTITRQITPRQ